MSEKIDEQTQPAELAQYVRREWCKMMSNYIEDQETTWLRLFGADLSFKIVTLIGETMKTDKYWEEVWSYIHNCKDEVLKEFVKQEKEPK